MALCANGMGQQAAAAGEPDAAPTSDCRHRLSPSCYQLLPSAINYRHLPSTIAFLPLTIVACLTLSLSLHLSFVLALSTQHNTPQHNTTQHNTPNSLSLRLSRSSMLFVALSPSFSPSLLRSMLGCCLCAMLHYDTTQHNTTQHNTTQHNTTQHNTTQHPKLTYK